MLVADIYEDAKEALGFVQQDRIFARLTDAIETLANKGSWEPLMAYVMIPVTNSNLVYLPDSVEVPIRVAIDNDPAFSRGRMYEFTMNGPGPYTERVDWSWEDLGEYNYKFADNAGNITGEQRIQKRLIRLSKSGNFVRMLVRLRTTKVTTLQDWIPLHSKMAIILMLKALESYRRGSPQDFQLGQGQEAQALKFLAEEQQSRNAYQDIANAMDHAPLIGYTYHSNNMVVVADIYDEAQEISGGIGKTHVFDAITEAVECLSNKGQWDAMTGVVTITPYGETIGLPRQVEIPIKININNKPSLSRSRLFEFSVNGPGTDLSETTTLQWVDQGSGPLIRKIDPPSTVSIGGYAADNGKKITLKGIDVNNQERSHTYVLHVTGESSEEISAPIVWKEVYEVNKDVSQSFMWITASIGLVAFYYPDETLPSFRQIKLSRQADEIRVLYRKTSLKITSVNDLIPLKSRAAILNMMRSLHLYKAPDLTPDKIQMAQALEQNALKYLQEEEQSRLAYIQASAKDMLPALGANYNSRGVVTAQDVYDDAADIFGPIGKQRLFDKITESVEMLANKSIWDGMDGYVDILVDQRGYISLPAKVEVPLGINYCRTPTQMRSRWYEFHMNGIGTSEDPVGQAGSSCGGGGYWDDVGEYPVIQEPPSPVRLYALTSFESDANRKIRAFGYDLTGNWIRSVESGKYVDGELVPLTLRVNFDEPITIPATRHEFSQITRVEKDASDMQIELWGGTSNFTEQDFTDPPILQQPPAGEPATPSFLAYYEAEETEPMFRRLRVPRWVTWVRMRYRSTTLKVTKMSDVINMRSKTALVTMMRALKALEAGQLDVAQGFETVATKLISEEQMSRNPAETFTLQFDTRTCFADPLQGQY